MGASSLGVRKKRGFGRDAPQRESREGEDNTKGSQRSIIELYSNSPTGTIREVKYRAREDVHPAYKREGSWRGGGVLFP